MVGFEHKFPHPPGQAWLEQQPWILTSLDHPPGASKAGLRNGTTAAEKVVSRAASALWSPPRCPLKFSLNTEGRGRQPSRHPGWQLAPLTCDGWQRKDGRGQGQPWGRLEAGRAEGAYCVQDPEWGSGGQGCCPSPGVR